MHKKRRCRTMRCRAGSGTWRTAPMSGLTTLLSFSGISLQATQAAATAVAREAAQIMANFEAGQDPVAEQTVAQFIRTLAMSIGHLAMVQLPFGGIYLIGGVARAMAPHFDRFDFVATLQDKGRFSDLARAFPIYVVEDDFAALVGCADHLAADF